VTVVEVLTHVVETLKSAKRCEKQLYKVASLLERECEILIEMQPPFNSQIVL